MLGRGLGLSQPWWRGGGSNNATLVDDGASNSKLICRSLALFTLICDTVHVIVRAASLDSQARSCSASSRGAVGGGAMGELLVLASLRGLATARDDNDEHAENSDDGAHQEYPGRTPGYFG